MTRTSSFRKRNRAIPGGRDRAGARKLRLARFVPSLVFLLLLAGLIVPHVLMGGVKLFFSIPGYLFLGAAAVAVGFVSFRRVQNGARPAPVISALLLGGYAIARSYHSPVEYLALDDRFMVMGALLVYLLTAFYLTAPKQRVGLLAVLFVVAGIDLVAGLIQFVQADNFMLLSRIPDGMLVPELFRPDYGERASGFLGCPNHLAGFLETLGLVALALTCLGRWNAAVRLVLGSAAAAAFVGLAFTGSRGGYLSTATGITAFLILVAWVVRKLRPKRFLLIVMIAIITGSTVITTAIALMSSNVLLSNRMANVIDTTNMRGEMWAAAMQQFHLAPVLGTGSGTYLYYGRQFRDESVQNDPVHVHSDYLELLAEYGIVGAALAGVFLVVHLHAGWRAMGRISRKRLRPAKRIFSTELALIAGTLAAVIALLAHSVVDFNAHIPSNTLFFAFLFGILASPSCDPQISGRPAPGGISLARFALPAAGFALIVLTAPRLAGEYYGEWARVQLRSKEHVDVAFDLSQRMVRGLPVAATGVVFPTDLIDRPWPVTISENHLLPRAQAFAEQGLQRASDNPDLYYYLGEIRHFQAMFARDSARKRELHQAAAAAYERAYRLFPMDVRILLPLARACDNLGLTQAAENYLSKAIAGDPKFSNVYSSYGFHLWRQRKLTRAEAYYTKALSLSGDNAVARAGLADIARLRALANDPRHVEMFGDPLENFDLEPPDEDDERRGVRLDE